MLDCKVFINMKILISEEQHSMYWLLRRINSHTMREELESVLNEILDYADVCNYPFDEFIEDIYYETTFSILNIYDIKLFDEDLNYIIKLISYILDKKYKKNIIRFYDKYKEDC